MPQKIAVSPCSSGNLISSYLLGGPLFDLLGRITDGHVEIPQRVLQVFPKDLSAQDLVTTPLSSGKESLATVSKRLSKRTPHNLRQRRWRKRLRSGVSAWLKTRFRLPFVPNAWVSKPRCRFHPTPDGRIRSAEGSITAQHRDCRDRVESDFGGTGEP